MLHHFSMNWKLTWDSLWPIQPDSWTTSFIGWSDSKDPIQKNDSFTSRTSPLCWLDCSRSRESEVWERVRVERWKSLPGHKTDGPRMNNFYGRGDIEGLSYFGLIQRAPVVLFKEPPTAFLPCFPRREGGENYPPPFFLEVTDWEWRVSCKLATADLVYIPCESSPSTLSARTAWIL